jgi:hypothetical protein
MKFEYNGKNYRVSDYQTIDNLLKDKEFLKLPMNIWKELLLFKHGSVSTTALRNILLTKINYYDNSEDVNSFVFNGIPCWLDKNTRVGLVNLANSASEPISLFLDPIFIEIDPENLKKYLAQVEVYASKCYVNTQKHLNAAKQLGSVEDLINYDYTKGYPEKIIINE